jgi:hypothetical protein
MNKETARAEDAGKESLHENETMCDVIRLFSKSIKGLTFCSIAINLTIEHNNTLFANRYFIF